MENRGNSKNRIWVPPPQGSSTSLSGVADSYATFLEVPYPTQRTKFKQLLRSNRSAAEAEAAVFSLLRSQGLNPIPSDSPGIGGPDFFCMPKSGASFSVEVAHIDNSAVEERTGLKNDLNEGLQSFSGIQQNLWAKANSKVKQLQGQNIASVLAICVSHSYSPVLIGKTAAEWFMAGEPMISVPVGNSEGNPCQVADLHGAPFLKIECGTVQAVREEISAILLCALSNVQLSVIGMLHPSPFVPFDIHQLPEVPYLKLVWPVQNGKVCCEWVQCEVRAAEYLHQSVSLTNAELASGHF